VGQRRGDLHLALEALGRLRDAAVGAHELEGGGPAQQGVAGEEDLAHGAAAELALDHVRAELLARRSARRRAGGRARPRQTKATATPVSTSRRPAG
jgi:hypothetical protein